MIKLRRICNWWWECSRRQILDLAGGFYDLVFDNEEYLLVYNITLEGEEQGESNELVNIQSTHIVEQNLKYIAGKTDYMIVEITTKKI